MFHNVSGICQPHFRVSMPSLSSFFAPCLAIRPAGGELDGGGRKGEEREGERGSIMRGHGLSLRLALPPRCGQVCRPSSQCVYIPPSHALLDIISLI